ncbi:MAG: hypothetical protein MUF53_06760 [Gemmatimonadaceae bacterium]|jgi:hypothetical protein|nr:hypothetical protein [Gemmatimonadaceae bacterium]
MPCRWTAPLLALLLGAVIHPREVGAQRREPDKGKPPVISLGQNIPNPVVSDTRIPFTLGDAACQNAPRAYRVSLRLYNLLSQVVAVPVVQTGPNGPAGNLPMENVTLSCGSYVAYWDGRYLSTGALAAPGIYLYRLEVEGATKVMKLIVAR